ncbi:cation diffusion facilitator family transporter [Amphibacillus marinus]|uniref:Cation diffusion facilitator family transporter n=1 Tax=Amphibacillus marinus TaxID=872970 RepID=A0A1H8KI59_9BACI|nr:cation diffusion facilitator family transporter [Amphibacillus marinus]SEN92266.1 cation diffusion facilitator family transporter [Amphibacillus marinus]
MKKRFADPQFATWISILLDIVLTAFKGFIGWISGSQALIADAAHSASDVLSSVAVLIGLRTARKPPDQDHPYGHGKAENIATIIVAFLLMLVGFEIFVASFKLLLNGDIQTPKGIALIAIATSILVKEGLFQYKYRLGKRLNSSALVADAWHHRSDALSSIAALFGVGMALIGYYLNIGLLALFDPLAGLVVAIIVIKVGVDLARESSSIIMEQVIDHKDAEPFHLTAANIAGVERIDELLARTHGHYIVIDIKVSVDPHISVEEGHLIGKAVKTTLLRQHPDVQRVLVHINPYNFE